MMQMRMMQMLNLANYVSIRRNSRQSKRIDSPRGYSITRQALKVSDGT